MLANADASHSLRLHNTGSILVGTGMTFSSFIYTYRYF